MHLCIRCMKGKMELSRNELIRMFNPTVYYDCFQCGRKTVKRIKVCQECSNYNERNWREICERNKK